MENINHGKISLKIAEVIAKEGISLNKLAFRSEMERSQLKSYIKGDVQRVDLNVLARLCHALDCEIHDILVYEKPDD